MTLYIVFAGQDFYPNGGGQDFKGFADDLLVAKMLPQSLGEPQWVEIWEDRTDHLYLVATGVGGWSIGEQYFVEWDDEPSDEIEGRWDYRLHGRTAGKTKERPEFWEPRPLPNLSSS